MAIEATAQHNAPCVEAAWREHHDELHRFLLKHCGNREAAEDLLQSVYTKALHHRARFCELDKPRAWLFRVARNQWTDEQRRAWRLVNGEPFEMPVEDNSPTPLESLCECIARALPNLTQTDRIILQRCDLEGIRQADFAEQHGLTLPAVKARLRRARRRLRAQLIEQCGISFASNGDICCHQADESTNYRSEA